MKMNLDAIVAIPTVTRDPKFAAFLENLINAEDAKPNQFRVILHNDAVTPVEQVIHVLIHVFGITRDRAIALMLQAHYNGEATIVVLTYKEAERVIDTAKALAMQIRCPNLTFSTEPV